MKFLLLLFSLSHAAKILVLYENPQVKVSHSNILEALEGQGFELSFKVDFILWPPEGQTFYFLSFRISTHVKLSAT